LKNKKYLISKSTLLHLRLPFSYFLLPIFQLAVIVSVQVNFKNFVIIFIILHLLLYTSSNGFNSYYDKDEGSIGTLKHSPKITGDLLWVSLGIDIIAIAVAMMVHPIFALGCFLYGLASKAYSWDKIRLKRMPFVSWMLIGSGVGTIAFLMIVIFLNKPDFKILIDPNYLIPAGVVGTFILGFYPLTQVYQHKEDLKRGDMTISMIIGINGTFVLSGILLSVSLLILGVYIYFFFTSFLLFLYIILQIPGIIYFLYWWTRVLKDKKEANFDHNFRLSFIATSGLNIFCITAIIILNKLKF